jgi:flagellar M-ring protein FliF
MKELMLKYKDKASETWSRFSNKQKFLVIGIIALAILTLFFLTYWATQPEYTVIYANLSEVEAGEIVQEIESRGISVQLSEDGRRISVPKTEATKLKLELAHAGIPRSGNINYGIFSENMGFGMTDNQFQVVRLDAMQSELRYLIEQIDGIDRAQVMLSLPERSIWVADDMQQASASVVLNIRPGTELSQAQINGLYHLISKSVPDLPVDNIVIMNHNMQYLEMIDEGVLDTTLAVYQQQRQVRREIERDIQRELHQLLGTIMGMDKVIVSVHASIDFSRERREEHLVEPVDTLTNEGIAISIERIQESFYGEGSPVGGIPGTGEGDIAGYQGVDGGQNNEYERLEERINREVNRIYREIEMSPYVIEDLTINVGIEPPQNNEDGTGLTDQDVEDIRAILRSVVRTYLSASSLDVTDADVIDQKVTVFANEFRGRSEFVADADETAFNWLYVLGAAALLIIGLLIFALIRRNRRNDELEATEEETPLGTFEDYDYNFEQENEETARRKRIERLARNKPEEFVKLLRTWLADD